MKPKNLSELEVSIEDAVKVFLNDESNEIINDRGDVFDSFNDFQKEFESVNDYLKSLRQGVADRDRQAVTEALAMMRIGIHNVGNVYLELSDLMSELVIEIRKDILAAKETEYESLPPLGLIDVNLKGEEGSFVFYLNKHSLFRDDLFEQICLAIQSCDATGKKIALMCFNLYSLILKSFVYHNDANDGYSIKNASAEDITGCIDKLEKLMQEKFE